MAVGGAGGCVPVFVLPPAGGKDEDQGVNVFHHLPYTRWLPWCDVAYFVSEAYARSSMPEVLTLLEALPQAQVDAKRQRLRELHPAFVFNPKSTLEAPSAAEFILAEACAAAKKLPSVERWMMKHPRSGPRRPRMAGGDHSQCLLLSDHRRAEPRGVVHPMAQFVVDGRAVQRPARYAPTGGIVPGGYVFKHERGY